MTFRLRPAIAGLLLAGAFLAVLWPISAYLFSPALMPAALALGAAGVLVVRLPEFGIALALALWPLRLLEVRIPLGQQTVELQPLEIGLPLLAVALFGYGLLIAAPQPLLRRPFVVVPVALFALTSVASAAQAIEPSAAVGAVAQLMTAAALFFAVLAICRERRALVTVVAGAVAGLLIAGAQGVYQELSGTTGDVYVVLQSEVVSRVNGSFGHPNQFAGFLSMLLPLAATMALSRAVVGHLRLLAAIALAFAVPALVLSYTRGAIVALVAGSLIWLAVVRPRLAIAVAAVAVAGVLLLAPAGLMERLESDPSADVALREDLRAAAIDIYAERPLLGVGVDNFREGYEALSATTAVGSQRRLLHNDEVLLPPHANNLFVNVLAEQGLIGMSAFIFLAVAALTVAYRSSRVEDGVGRAVGVGLGAGLLAFGFHNLVEVTLLPLILPLFALIAVTAVFVERDKERLASSPHRPSEPSPEAASASPPP